MTNGSFFEVEPGIELYYEEQGKGLPLVFVPGWTFTTEVFRHQFSAFAPTHRVISFDPRSQGRSTQVVQGNDYKTQSADLARLIDHLGLDRPIILAWSNASLAAWGYVRMRGTKALRAMVTIDIPPAPLTAKPDDWNEFSMVDAAQFYQSLLTPRGHRETVTSLCSRNHGGSATCRRKSWIGSLTCQPERRAGQRLPIAQRVGSRTTCPKPSGWTRSCQP